MWTIITDLRVYSQSLHCSQYGNFLDISSYHRTITCGTGNGNGIQGMPACHNKALGATQQITNQSRQRHGNRRMSVRALHYDDGSVEGDLQLCRKQTRCQRWQAKKASVRLYVHVHSDHFILDLHHSVRCRSHGFRNGLIDCNGIYTTELNDQYADSNKLLLVTKGHIAQEMDLKT